MDQLPADRPQSRTRVVAGAVVLAYVAFAVFAQLIGEDEEARGEAARFDGFCTAVYADYPGLLSAVASQAGSGGPFDGRNFYGSFFESAGVAPEEFQDEVATLIEGLELASSGELTRAEVDAYIQTYEELRTAATPTCNQVAEEIRLDEPTE
jgi:hypothetical protein